jgi:hypothetical protein
MAADETPAQPDMGHASPSDLASVARASNAPAVTELIPAAQPDVAPAPDGNAGDPYEAAAQQYTLGPHRTGLASDPKFRALVDGIRDAARAPLLASIQHVMAVADQEAAVHGERLAEAIRERDEARAKAVDGSTIRLVHSALVGGVQECRYHGKNFGFLGWERAEPRCDSCKQPYRVKRALDQLDVVIRVFAVDDDDTVQVMVFGPDETVEDGEI